MYKFPLLRKLTVMALSILSAGYMGVIHAHDASNVMIDPNGNVAGFTGYAVISCSPGEGTGTPTEYLLVQIEDLSPPQDNLFLSVQVIKEKGRVAANATDLISGDGEPSPEARAYGGDGNYLVLVNKTAAGMREFNFVYHCFNDSLNEHTQTSPPNVLYYQ